MNDSMPILTSQQMRQHYGAFYDRTPKLKLDKGNVPHELWPLLPYAEFWGVADDFMREELVDEAPVDIRTNLKRAVLANEDALEHWLAGPEADSSTLTKEYIAFAAMFRAADFI
jgi:hypothetical protein